MENNTQQKPEEKTKTAFPGLHQAMGGDPSKIEVVKADANTQQQDANTQQQQQANTQQSDANTQQQASPDANTQQQQQQKPVLNYEDLSDEQKNEFLVKMSGGKIKSVDELNPPVQKSAEDLEKEQQALRTSALSWALENGKVKQSDYDKAIVDRSKTNRELALAAFTANLRENDKDIEDDEALELFKDAFHEGADEKSKLYAIGQKQIDQLGEAYRKTAFSAIDNIEPDYKEYLQTENQFKGYKTTIKKLVAELPKEMSVDIPFKNIDGSTTTLTYKVPVEEAVTNKILSDYTSQKAFVTRNVLSEGNIDQKVLVNEMNVLVKSMMFDKVLPQMLQEHGDAVEKLLMVQLGNKRQPGPQLNNGLQNTQTKAPVKNEYPGLKQAMANR